MNDKRRRRTSNIRPLREEQGESARFTATQAKNEFSRALEMVLQGGRIVITMQDSPKAILVSVEEFIKRTHPTEFWLSPEEIHVLIAVLRSHGAHDSLFARMQTPEARTAMKAAYAASSKELGRAAVIAARKPAIATRKRG